MVSQEFVQITPEFGFQWLLCDICVKNNGQWSQIMNVILADIPSKYHDFKVRGEKKKIHMRRGRKQKYLLAIFFFTEITQMIVESLNTIWPIKYEPSSFQSNCEGAVVLPAEYI